MDVLLYIMCISACMYLLERTVSLYSIYALPLHSFSRFVKECLFSYFPVLTPGPRPLRSLGPESRRTVNISRTACQSL